MRMMERSSWLVLAALFAIGCSSRPSRIEPPAIDSGAAEAAVEQFDTNGDKVLDENELGSVPPLKAALARIDQNGDRKVNASEIEARIKAWKDARIGLMPMTIRLNSNSSPLAGAEVTLMPEKFLGDHLKMARGTTNQHGVAVMEISNKRDERGVASGFYRISVSKKSGSGTESIPARYNTQTQLGLEVEPLSPESRDASFNLAL
ncbi:MAG: hypothetical protein IT425_04755 [Pirellulales bacterium]|nr:hypothetical protein [Pirellulales bacterium]